LVNTRSLQSLFDEYGVPYYCKIDIEGSDKYALKSLLGNTDRPKFLSVETECIGTEKQLCNEEALETLLILNKLGYSSFKLIDQVSLHRLLPSKPFYNMNYLNKIVLKTRYLFWKNYRDKLNKQFNFNFLPGCSGPFGDDIPGDWLDFNTAKATLLYHRKFYFKKGDALNYGFWCDWHARLG
jgi:hypothetical protein